MIERLMNRLEEGLLILLLAAMTLLTFSQVVLRYVFNTGWGWALEATTYMFGWLVMIGISYGIKVGFHIGVDALVKLLPKGGQRAIGLVAALLCLAYAVILTIGGYNYFDTMHMLGVEAEDIPLPRWMLVIIVPIGFGLLGFRLAQMTWRILTGRIGGFNLGDEAAEVLRSSLTGPGGQSGTDSDGAPR
ncbi:TRAP transporter small permease [Ferrovibrio sp.]|uniref:TRAP transporter small permease n=1 Tax=Ferrovibrio sp. TaxID=1917215 RepID=UPI00311D7C1A